MYTHFFLGAATHEMYTPGVIAAKYNIEKKLNTLSYCNYSRIHLTLTNNKQENPDRMGVWWDTGKRADVQWYTDEKTFRRKIMFLKGHEEPAVVFGYFQNSHWRDNEYFLLSDCNKEIYFDFNVNKDEFSVEFKPVHSLEIAQNKLKSFEAGLTQEERNKLFGLPY